MNDVGAKIIQERYCNEGEDSWEQVCTRVATFIATNDTKEDRKKYVDLYFDLMYNYTFLPASPVFFNAGVNGQGSLSPCFGLVVQDSMESIMENERLIAMILKYGGGVGINLSNLRPKGAKIKTTHGKAMGPVGVLKHYDSLGTLVTQAGKRKAAMLGILNAKHKDIDEFITCKEAEGALSNFNISVGVTYKDLKSKKFVEKIAKHIYNNGEPGLIYWDNIASSNPFENEELITANPCGEVPTFDKGHCCLGSINLTKIFHGKKGIDWDKFNNIVYLAVRFLDNVLDLNCYPDESIEEKALKYRPIGLGVMGLADLFILMGHKYGENKSLELTEKIFRNLRKYAYDASCDIGTQRGFLDGLPRRNTTLLSIAPTGSLSRIADVSPGIEPNFAKETTSIILDKKITHRHLLADEKAFVSSTEVSPAKQIAIVSMAQAYVDNGISKTINLPNDISMDEIVNNIITAHTMKLKGVTFYRDGSRKHQQIVDSKKKTSSKNRPAKLTGETIKVKTGLGTMYVTVNSNKDNKPYEVFAILGKGGNDSSSYTEALGRLISVGLQNGIEIGELSKQLVNISGSSQAINNGKRVLSVPDAIGKALKEYEENTNNSDEDFIDLCQECGNRLIFQEGCASCECGFSRCA